MPRSAGQSDFVVERPPIAVVDDAAPLPTAIVRTTEASEFATRWVMRATWFMLLALALLCAIGPHIPAGE